MKELSIVDFIQLVKKRPGMYVFSEGITEFSGLLHGFSYSHQPKENEDILRDFTNWLKQEKYQNFEDYSISWCRILLFYYSCESRALKKFFEYWDEFIESRKGKKGATY